MEEDQLDRARAAAGAQQPGAGPAGLLQEPSPRLPTADAGGGGRRDESAGRTLPPPTVGGTLLSSRGSSLQASIFSRSRVAWGSAASRSLSPSAG